MTTSILSSTALIASTSSPSTIKRSQNSPTAGASAFAALAAGTSSRL